MQKAFTLIELIFVIVIIGLLATIAVPKFVNLTSHAKNASIKSVVNSVQDSVENIHSKWLVNEDFKWDPDGDGDDDLNETSGYPKYLDDGNSSETKLFKYVLKVPIMSCSSDSAISCWSEYDDNKYEYRFSSSKKLKVEYNSSNGLLGCIDGDGVTKADCEKIIY